MTTDLDIYRNAKLLIDQRGEDAPVRATLRVDEPKDAGDMIGCDYGA